MKKLHFVSKESIPAEVSRSSDPVKAMLDCGLLDSLRAESRGRPGGVIRCRANQRGLYLWVEYPDEPKGITATGVIMLLAYYLAVSSTIGVLATGVKHWLLGAELQVQLFLVRGLLFGGLAAMIPFMINRYDRVLFFRGLMLCATAMMLSIGGPLMFLVSRGDYAGILIVVCMVVIHRSALSLR